MLKSPVILRLLTVFFAILLISGASGEDGPTGHILRDYWIDLPGVKVSDLTDCGDFPDSPSGSNMLDLFEAPTDWADNYGTLVRGYVHPPITGQYTFWIASDDSGELWLSTSDDPAKKVKIAMISEWTAPRDWTHLPEQKSQPITLSAGKKYYIEALQKEGGGGDNLAVGWTLPDKKDERPIPGNRLSPFNAHYVKGVQLSPVAKLLDALPTAPGHHKLKAEVTLKGKTTVITYVLFLPQNYDKTKDPFPLFTFLHGNTHQGNDWTGVLNEGPAQFLNDNKALREWMPMIGFFPQCPANQRWDNRPQIRNVVAILDEIIKQFRVDRQRVYCTGLSMGGMGTWNTALEAPDRFAAIATISAVAVRPEEAVEKLKNTPIWIIAGGDDGGFMEGSKAMKAAFDKAGCKQVELTVVPGEGHGVWGRYYPEKRFYEWLLKHRRPDPAPPVEAPKAVIAQAPAIKNLPEQPKAPAIKVESAMVAVTPASIPMPETKAVVSNIGAQTVRPSAGTPIAVTLSLAAVFMMLALYFFASPEATESKFTAEDAEARGGRHTDSKQLRPVLKRIALQGKDQEKC